MFQRYLNMLAGAGLGKCLALAAASTAAWYLLWKLSDALPASELLGLLLLWTTGTVYSALVLFRYLDPGNLSWRPVVIGLGGALCYWIGVQYATELRPSQNDIIDTAVAGVITAAFVGYLVIRFGTIRFAWGPFAALCAAGAIGGAMIGWAVHNVFRDGELEFIAGHAAWQMLTCIALFYSPKAVSQA